MLGVQDFYQGWGELMVVVFFFLNKKQNFLCSLMHGIFLNDTLCFRLTLEEVREQR